MYLSQFLHLRITNCQVFYLQYLIFVFLIVNIFLFNTVFKSIEENNANEKRKTLR